MSRHKKKFKINDLCDVREFRSFIDSYRKRDEVPHVFRDTDENKNLFWRLVGHDHTKRIDDVTLNKLFNIFLGLITVQKPSRTDFINALRVYRAWFEAHNDLIQSNMCIDKIDRLIGDERLFEKVIMVNDGSFLNNRVSILHCGSYNTPSVELRDYSLTMGEVVNMSTNKRFDHMMKKYSHICCQFRLNATIESIDEEIKFRNKMEMGEEY